MEREGVERRRAGTGGEKRGVTKKGQKAKIYWEKDKRTHQIVKNAKIGEQEQEEREEGEGSH